MVARTSGAVQGIGFLLVLPLSFGSNTFVATDTMPGWLQAFVHVNPISHLVSTMRALMTGGAYATDLVWTLGWMAVLLVVFVPLALRAYAPAGLSQAGGSRVEPRGRRRLVERPAGRVRGVEGVAEPLAQRGGQPRDHRLGRVVGAPHPGGGAAGPWPPPPGRPGQGEGGDGQPDGGEDRHVVGPAGRG